MISYAANTRDTRSEPVVFPHGPDASSGGSKSVGVVVGKSAFAVIIITTSASRLETIRQMPAERGCPANT